MVRRQDAANGGEAHHLPMTKNLDAEDVALRWAIGAAERELGPSHPTTQQLVARRVTVLIRLGRDAEAAALGAGAGPTMAKND